MMIVTSKAMRPASAKEQCFYCQQPIGQPHKDDCVMIVKRVKVRMVVEYEVEVPAYWSGEQIEFHRNQGSWCADNAIEELEALSESQKCLCHHAHFQYIRDTSEPYLKE